MVKHFGKAIAGIGGAAVLAASAAVALASIPDFAADDEAAYDFAPGAERMLLPTPAAGVDLFTVDSDSACMTDAEILAHLDQDRAQIGGEMIMLSEGFDQAFTDAWRQTVDAEPASVSAVYAHVFGNEEQGFVFDVVEVDPSGCALSRTLMSGDEWDYLINQAVGVSV